MLASENDGKVSLVVSVTKDLTSRIQAGQLVKQLAPIVGGGGGGRPDFAEAGGKDPSKIDELLAKAPDVSAQFCNLLRTRQRQFRTRACRSGALVPIESP